jgi:hypothetical protein
MFVSLNEGEVELRERTGEYDQSGMFLGKEGIHQKILHDSV